MPTHERNGSILALISAVMYGIFPVVVNYGSRYLMPLTFAAISTLLAAVGSLSYAAFQGNLNQLRKKEAYSSLLMVSLCIVIVPYTLFFIGSSKTSGVNTSFLLLSEAVFTLIFTPLIGEKTTFEKLLSAIGVLIGAGLILYNGSFRLNWGDLLIIGSTVTYPIGNFYAKKALYQVSPSIILLSRFSIGGLFILALSLFTGSSSMSTVLKQWPLLLFTGLVLLGVGKIVFYEALGRLDITKAISLGMTFPLFSLILLIGVFREKITVYQWLGIAIMMIGVFLSVRRPSTDPKLTKYST
jgi:drug/metabolite transporter (DMT)-like permease